MFNGISAFVKINCILHAEFELPILEIVEFQIKQKNLVKLTVLDKRYKFI